MYCWRTALLRRELDDTDAMFTFNQRQWCLYYIMWHVSSGVCFPVIHPLFFPPLLHLRTFLSLHFSNFRISFIHSFLPHQTSVTFFFYFFLIYFLTGNTKKVKSVRCFRLVLHFTILFPPFWSNSVKVGPGRTWNTFALDWPLIIRLTAAVNVASSCGIIVHQHLPTPNPSRFRAVMISLWNSTTVNTNKIQPGKTVMLVTFDVSYNVGLLNVLVHVEILFHTSARRQ